MPLTDDEFVKNNKSETYLDIIDQLHEENDQFEEVNYEFDLEEEDD